MQPALGSSQPPSPSTLAAVGQESAFGVGKAIGHTFSAWWRHAFAFSLLTLMAYVPMYLPALLSGAPIAGLTMPTPNPFDAAAVAAARAGPRPGFWLGNVATMLLLAVEAGAITHGAIRHLAGKPVSLGGMIATGFRRLLPLLVVGVLCYVIFLLGFMLLVVPGVYLACALSAAVPAVVVERPGILGALRRSFALTKGKRLAIFAVFLVLFLVAMVVTVFSTFVLPQLTAAFAPMLGTLLGFAVNVLFGTLLWVAPGVVYHDLRVAKEGIETAQLAAIFE